MSEATLWWEIEVLWGYIVGNVRELYERVKTNKNNIEALTLDLASEIAGLETKLINLFAPVVLDLQSQITKNNTNITTRLDAVVDGVVLELSNIATKFTTTITNFDGLIEIVEDKIKGVTTLLDINISRIDSKLSFLEGLFIELGKDLNVSELTKIGDKINTYKKELTDLIASSKGSGVFELFDILQNKLNPVIDFINLFKLYGSNNSTINKLHQVNTLTGISQTLTPLRNQIFYILPKRKPESTLLKLFKQLGI